jgi:bacteriorhodopsin
VGTGETPTVYRYIDWLITVPLLMVEFYIILRACTAVAGGVFWKINDWFTSNVNWWIFR